MKRLPTACYLCGKPLVRPPLLINDDHVPPKQLFAREIRKAHSPNLLTIPVHKSCNYAYQHDEDYFVNTLAPYGMDSHSGSALRREIFAKYAAGEKRGLVHKVVQSFDVAPGGIVLPPNLIAHHIEGSRIHRVAWKIVRGLYFHEHAVVLPIDTPNDFEIAPPDRPPPKAFLDALGDLDSRGIHPGVFDYKYVIFPTVNDFNYWGLLLWDRLILIMSFHSPTCPCDHCITLPSRMAGRSAT